MPENLDQGYLALPAGEERVPAVMVLPAWWGLSPFFKQFCDRLADAGFVAFAPDIYQGKIAETIEQAEAFSGALDMPATGEWIYHAAGALRQHPRSDGQPIGVIGFSLGAFLGLSLLQHAPDQLRALVLFYGSGPTPFPHSSAAVLAHFAETDPYEPLESQVALREAFAAAGINATIQTYPGTGHWFFEANQPNAYNAEAASLAWDRTIAFLKTHLAASR